jgi:hypothetical protein
MCLVERFIMAVTRSEFLTDVSLKIHGRVVASALPFSERDFIKYSSPVAASELYPKNKQMFSN